MGGCLSLNSLSAISNSNVRVIHLNGWIQEYDFPVPVWQLTGSPPKYFLFTAAELLSTRLKPLKPDTLLELGSLYFLLPSSTFQAELHPADLVNIVKTLTGKAKARKPTEANNESPSPAASSPIAASSTSSNGVFEMKDTIQRGSRKNSWKPMLDTIREKSFSRRSESDLNERHSGEHDKLLFLGSFTEIYQLI